MRDRIALFLMAGALLGGCGDGGGGGDDRIEPTATPVATVTVVPESTVTVSTSPTPSTTATPFPEILLAAGRRFGASNTETPFVLRSEGGGWVALRVDAPAQTVLNGIVFSTPDVAWAFGFVGDQETGVVLRSADGGSTWVDVTARLPSHTKGIDDMAFADADDGFLVDRGIFGGAQSLATHDGGMSWEIVDVPSSGAIIGSYAIGVRSGAAELVRYQDDGLSIVRLDDPSIVPLVLAPSGGSSIAGGNSYATLGGRGLLAVTVPTNDEFPPSRAAILASSNPGAAWVEEPVDHSGWEELSAIDVRDPQHGLAGGIRIPTISAALDALVLVLSDDGSSWQTAPIAGLRSGFAVRDVLCARGDVAWAVAIDVISGAAETAFLRSDDGGRSWERAVTGFERDVQVQDLARNTDLH